MEDGAAHGHVIEFLAFSRPAEQQTAAAHVTPADEVDWKAQALAEDAEEHVHVLRRRDAAEQHHVAVGSDLAPHRARAALERAPVLRIVLVNVALGELAQRLVGDERVGAAQPGRRRDDVYAASDDRIVPLRRGSRTTR